MLVEYPCCHYWCIYVRYSFYRELELAFNYLVLKHKMLVIIMNRTIQQLSSLSAVQHCQFVGAIPKLCVNYISFSYVFISRLIFNYRYFYCHGDEIEQSV